MSDPIVVLREALVSALDTAPGITTLTGRASGNVVPFEDIGDDPPLPILAYQATAADDLPPMAGDYNATVTFSAVAATEADAHALIGAVFDALTWQALFNATPALDAAVLSRSRRPFGYEGEAEAYRVDGDVQLFYALIPPPERRALAAAIAADASLVVAFASRRHAQATAAAAPALVANLVGRRPSTVAVAAPAILTATLSTRFVDQLGFLDLAADTPALGGTLLGGWHASVTTRSGTDVSVWTPAFQGFDLTAFGTTLPQFDPDTETITLDDAAGNCFQGAGAILSQLTDSMAVIVVCRRATNLAAAPRLVVVSQDFAPAFMVAEFSQPGTNPLFDLYATGISGSLTEIDLLQMTGRQALHVARGAIGSDQHFYLRRGRNPTSHGDFPGGGATTGAANLLTIGSNREVPPSTKFCALTELAAVLLFDLADDAGYSDALANRINDWCEAFAGAVP